MFPLVSFFSEVYVIPKYSILLQGVKSAQTQHAQEQNNICSCITPLV